MMSTVPTSSTDRSDVLFPYNRSMHSGGMLFKCMQSSTDSRALSRCESAFCFCSWFVVWHATLKQVIHLHCQHHLGSRKRNYSFSAWKTFCNNVKFLHKEYWTVKCLQLCYRSRTASCKDVCAVYFSPVWHSSHFTAMPLFCSCSSWPGDILRHRY